MTAEYLVARHMWLCLTTLTDILYFIVSNMTDFSAARRCGCSVTLSKAALTRCIVSTVKPYCPLHRHALLLTLNSHFLIFAILDPENYHICPYLICLDYGSRFFFLMPISYTSSNSFAWLDSMRTRLSPSCNSGPPAGRLNESRMSAGSQADGIAEKSIRHFREMPYACWA